MKNNDIIRHKATEHTGHGIFLKEMTSQYASTLVRYTHSDDYYIFGIVGNGTCRVSIDFREYVFSKKQIICIHPNQIHHYIDASLDVDAAILLIDTTFIDDSSRLILDEYLLSNAPLIPSEEQEKELQTLFKLIAVRMKKTLDETSHLVVRGLANAIVGIVTEIMAVGLDNRSVSGRQLEIVTQLKKLLSDTVPLRRSPSFYASQLNLSEIYLNEVVKRVTGVNVGRYIQNEVLLQAKRLLYYTDKNIAEIAEACGFEDYAYFTKLFSRQTGISPQAFRSRYLK